MQITLELPEDIAQGVESKWKDLSRVALESLALEAYRSHASRAAQLRRLRHVLEQRLRARHMAATRCLTPPSHHRQREVCKTTEALYDSADAPDGGVRVDNGDGPQTSCDLGGPKYGFSQDSIDRLLVWILIGVVAGCTLWWKPTRRG